MPPHEKWQTDLKSDFLLQVSKELVKKSRDFGINLAICGGVAVNLLSDFLKQDSPRRWKHKDIDLVVPLSQFATAIAFFKSLGYIKAVVSYKRRRLVKNHVRFVGEVYKKKVLVDVYGLSKVPTIEIEKDNNRILLLSPRIELENWKDRQERVGAKPSISLSIKLLQYTVRNKIFQEKEIT